MLKRPTIYNAWRHVFYLYPLIILMAIKGIHSLLIAAKYRRQRYGIFLLLCCSILYNAILNVCNHPFEFMSFNPVGQIVGSKYERDYWEAGVYHVMDWIITQEADNQNRFSIGDVNVVRHNMRADYFFLPAENQAKVYIPSTDTDYIIFRHDTTNSDKAGVDGYSKIREFCAYNVKIYSVFKKD